MKALRLLAFFLVGLWLGGAAAFAWAGPETYGRSMNINAAPGNVGAARPGWYSNPVYDFPDAPNGWGKMRDLNRMSIGGKILELQGWRNFAPRALAATGVGLARMGPLAIGMTLAPLIWDELSKQWMKPGEETDDLPAAPLTEATACAYIGRVGGTAYDITTGDHYRIAAENDSSWYAQGYAYLRACIGAPFTSPWPQLLRKAGLGTPPEPNETRPATEQEIEDAIYVELVARGMGSELARRLIAQGYRPSVDSVGAQGPSSAEGTTSTTTETVTVDQGHGTGTQTTVTTTTHNITYNTTNNVTNVNVTTVTNTTTTHPDGTQSETNTETAPPDLEPGEEPAEEEQYTLDYQGSTMPEIPDFYAQQYPEGFAGEWNKFKDKVASSPLAGFLTGLSNGLPGGGTCPEWSVSLNFGHMGNFGTHVIAPPCAIWPFIKAVMILSALFVARRMVFGG